MKNLFIKYLIFIILSLLSTSTARSQNLMWAKQFSGAGIEDIKALKIGSTGNVYSTGYFSDSTDFDPGINTYILGTPSSQGLYISKLDENGNFIWAKAISSLYGSPYSRALTLDSLDNIYIAGNFSSVTDFDPGMNTYQMTPTSGNAFILKLDSAGNFLWVKQFFANSIESITVDANLNIITTGYFTNTSDVDPGLNIYNLTSNGYYDIFILKLDSIGNFLWANGFGSIWDDKGIETATDVNNDVIVVGSFAGTIDFDPGIGVLNLSTSNYYTQDAFVCKFDEYGNIKWAKQTYGTMNNTVVPSAMTTDVNNNIFITGYFDGPGGIDFDPGATIFFLETPNGFSDMFVWRLNSYGDFAWVKQFTSLSPDVGDAIAVDNSGNVYTTGKFANTFDFDPDSTSYLLTNNGYSNTFLSVLNSGGHFISASTFVSDSINSGYVLDTDNSGNIYLGGTFRGLTDFDPTNNNYFLIPAGQLDPYIFKSGSYTGLGNLESRIENITLFPNPCNGYFSIDTNLSINEIKIYNTRGEIVYNYNQIYQGTRIDFNYEGLFYVEIITNNAIFISKLISIFK